MYMYMYIYMHLFRSLGAKIFIFLLYIFTIFTIKYLCKYNVLSFINVTTQVLRRFKPCLRFIGGSNPVCWGFVMVRISDNGPGCK